MGNRSAIGSWTFGSSRCCAAAVVIPDRNGCASVRPTLRPVGPLARRDAPEYEAVALRAVTGPTSLTSISRCSADAIGSIKASGVRRADVLRTIAQRTLRSLPAGALRRHRDGLRHRVPPRLKTCRLVRQAPTSSVDLRRLASDGSHSQLRRPVRRQLEALGFAVGLPFRPCAERNNSFRCVGGYRETRRHRWRRREAGGSGASVSSRRTPSCRPCS